MLSRWSHSAAIVRRRLGTTHPPGPLGLLLHPAQLLVGQLLGDQLHDVGAALRRQRFEHLPGLLTQGHGFHSVIMERSS